MVTAVEWLVQQFELASKFPAIKKVIEQAKEMEKQQIIDAYNKGSDVDEDLKPMWGTPKQYYNDKFNK